MLCQAKASYSFASIALLNYMGFRCWHLATNIKVILWKRINKLKPHIIQLQVTQNLHVNFFLLSFKSMFGNIITPQRNFFKDLINAFLKFHKMFSCLSSFGGRKCKLPPKLKVEAKKKNYELYSSTMSKLETYVL